MLRPAPLLCAVFVVLAAVLFVPVHAERSTSLPPSEGLEVVGDEEIVGQSILFRGNVTVRSGATLTIKDSVLVFDSNRTHHQGFLVEEGGTLVMRNSTVEAVNLSEGFSFVADGRVDIRNCNIGGIFTTTVGLRWIGGFKIRSDNSVIRDTVFARARGYAIRCEGARNFTFSDNLVYATATALLLNHSTGSVTGNWFFNNSDRQVVIQNCDGVRFEKNVVNGTGMGGVILVNSRNVKLSGNQIEGPFYVVYVKGSQMNMEGDVLFGQQIQLEARDSSKVVAQDCVINIKRTRTEGSSEIVVKKTVKVRVLVGGKPVEGAIVTVRNLDGDTVAKGETSSDGVAQFVLTQARVTDSGVELFDPHTFKVVKGLRSFTGTANITSESQLEASLHLPWGLIILAAVFLVLAAIVVLAPPRGERGRRTKRHS